ncbi:hypothetical protein V8C42DRAFT_321095 [Trichoderma barbatum]
MLISLAAEALRLGINLLLAVLLYMCTSPVSGSLCTKGFIVPGFWFSPVSRPSPIGAKRVGMFVSIALILLCPDGNAFSDFRSWQDSSFSLWGAWKRKGYGTKLERWFCSHNHVRQLWNLFTDGRSLPC